MKPARFDHVLPRDVEEALRVLADNPGSARVLAGGQSLVPLLNMRMASPEILVDINRIEALSGMTDHGSFIRIGAVTRYRELQASPLIAAELPLIPAALEYVAHPAIRNRGTLGGSLALADPAGEMPAVALALDATILARSVRGERRIAIDDFLQGIWATALDEDELLVAIDYPKRNAGRHAFREFSRRHGDFALAGIVLTAHRSEARCVVFGVGQRGFRVPEAEAWLPSRTREPVPAEIKSAVVQAVLAADTANEDAESRAAMAATLFVRAVTDLDTPAVRQ